MHKAYDVHELITLITEAVASVSPDAGPLGPDAALIGEQPVLDSVGFVTLLVDLEEKLQGSVDLATAFMAHDNPDAIDHPFRTVGSLAAHLQGALAAP